MNQATTVPIRSLEAPTRRPPRRWTKHVWGYLFLLPAAVIFFTFLWLPIGKGIVFSFYHIDFVKGDSYVGLANYHKILKDPDVMISVKNTLYYMSLGVLMGFWVPLLFAIAISEMRRFQGFARIAAYLPYVVPSIVLYGLWRWLYDPVGPINALLEKIGLNQVLFLTDKSWSMISIVFMETWQNFGSAMLIYLAAVLSVPRDWYEAAEIDGAGVWKRIRHITLPTIKNQIVLLFLLQIIATSQGFQTHFALLDGGPNNATLTYALLVTRYAFIRQDYGLASALGVLMFLVLGLLAILQYRMSNKKEA
jgi:multiple sugar transport system permease protein